MALNEGACNHLTAMAPAKSGVEGEEVMLVTPGKFKLWLKDFVRGSSNRFFSCTLPFLALSITFSILQQCK